MNHPDEIMIDCETLGLAFNAPIISIGAVFFNRHTGNIGPTFYVEIDIQQALDHGRPSGLSLRWLRQQNDGPLVQSGQRESLQQYLWAGRDCAECDC